MKGNWLIKKNIEIMFMQYIFKSRFLCVCVCVCVYIQKQLS